MFALQFRRSSCQEDQTIPARRVGRIRCFGLIVCPYGTRDAAVDQSKLARDQLQQLVVSVGGDQREHGLVPPYASGGPACSAWKFPPVLARRSKKIRSIASSVSELPSAHPKAPAGSSATDQRARRLTPKSDASSVFKIERHHQGVAAVVGVSTIDRSHSSSASAGRLGRRATSHLYEDLEPVLYGPYVQAHPVRAAAGRGWRDQYRRPPRGKLAVHGPMALSRRRSQSLDRARLAAPFTLSRYRHVFRLLRVNYDAFRDERGELHRERTASAGDSGRTSRASRLGRSPRGGLCRAVRERRQ